MKIATGVKPKNWAQWWSQSTHLKMLCKSLSDMTDSVWDKCPSTTNAVERKNRDCSSNSPQYPKLAMMQAYKVDKVVYVINTWQLKKEQVHLTEVRQTKQEHPMH